MAKSPPSPPRGRFASSFVIAAALLVVAAAVSCRLPTLPTPQSSHASGLGGTLEIAIAGNTAKTLLPGIDMNIAGYQVQGVGPNGAIFSLSTSKTTNQVTGLVVGAWNVTVAALNGAGQNIGIGSSSVTLSSTDAVSLTITVTPIQGDGTLSLTTTWPASQVTSPSITASLLPPAGSAIPLTYTIDSGTATVNDGSIPSGYYTLSQTLLSGGMVVMGAVEVVRIVAGQATSGTFDFSNANAVDPTLSVNITPAMSDPLPIALSGAASSITFGGSMTVTPSVAGYSGNATFVYYLNGQAKASTNSASPSWTLGSELAPGNYRLDVTAFSADGLRAGSATVTFAVTVPAGAVVLAWNPDSDPTVTGYNVDYGKSSGTYTAVVDAGARAMVEISGLTPGQTYYFAATAYTSAGVQSSFSNEISYTVPAS